MTEHAALERPGRERPPGHHGHAEHGPAPHDAARRDGSPVDRTAVQRDGPPAPGASAATGLDDPDTAAAAAAQERLLAQAAGPPPPAPTARPAPPPAGSAAGGDGAPGARGGTSGPQRPPPDAAAGPGSPPPAPAPDDELPDPGAPDVPDADLISHELAEYERWAGAALRVGGAGSTQRAAFLAESVGSGAVGGAAAGAGMGLAAGVGARAATYGVSKGLSSLLSAKLGGKFVPVPGVGPMIGGALALGGLLSRDWGQTGQAVALMGTGTTEYERLANTLTAVAEILDVVGNVITVLAGVLGIAAALTWAITLATAGAASPVAFTISSLALMIGLVGDVYSGIGSMVIQPLAVMFRSMHAFTSQADPRHVEAQGTKLAASAAATAGQLGGFAGGKAAGRVPSPVKAPNVPGPHPHPAGRAAEAGPDPAVVVEPAPATGPAGGPAGPAGDTPEGVPWLHPEDADLPPSSRTGDVEGDTEVDRVIELDEGDVDLVEPAPADQPPPREQVEAVSPRPGDVDDEPTVVDGRPPDTDDEAGPAAWGKQREPPTGEPTLWQRITGARPVGASQTYSDHAAASRDFEVWVRQDRGRECGVWHNADTGESILVQGDSGSVWTPARARARGADGSLLEPGWQLTDHYHPGRGPRGTAGDMDVIPSGSRGDVGVMQGESGRTGQARGSRVHYAEGAGAKGRWGSSDFGYDPSKPRPVWIEGPFGLNGERQRLDFADSAEYDRWSGSYMSKRLRRGQAAAVSAGVKDLARRGSPTGGPGAAGFWAGMRLAANASQADLLLGDMQSAGTETARRLPVDPPYTAPPGTPEQLAAYLAERDRLTAERRRAEDVERHLGAQEEHHRANTGPLAEAVGGTAGGVGASEDHTGEVDRTGGANADQRGKEGEAGGLVSGYPARAAGAASLGATLGAFTGGVSLISGWDYPGKPTLTKMATDAARLRAELAKVDTHMAQQASVQPARTAALQADADRIAEARRQAATTTTAMQQANRGASELQAENAARTAEAATGKDTASKEAAQLEGAEEGQQAAHDELAAQLQAWAQSQRLARRAAFEAARAQITGQPMRIVEEVGAP